MEQQCLATLQTLLTDCGAARIGQPLLEGFYKYCARQPAAIYPRLASCPLKTLLYHYRFLRPEVQKALKEFITKHWRTFAAEAELPDTGGGTPSTDPDPVIPVPESSPVVHRFPSPVKRDDWFERFLDVVRILLFR